MSSKKKSKHTAQPEPEKKSPRLKLILVSVVILAIFVSWFAFFYHGKDTTSVQSPPPTSQTTTTAPVVQDTWIERAKAVTDYFHIVYTPCWEGAYGAIGDAYLFAASHDSSLMRFHLFDHALRNMCEGTWVDDRAWICIAEYTWWNFTGKQQAWLIQDAKRRYLDARSNGNLSNHEGFWSWYNWPPDHPNNQRIFSNGATNQMATVAADLYDATGEQHFLDDALLIWNGDKKTPGIEKTLYHGDGVWMGKAGLAAFGKQIAWDGAEYCSLGAALYRVTKDPKYKKIVVATASRIMDPANGWVDGEDFYQINMDGNGAFVNFLLDSYAIAPDELHDLLPKIEKMLDHVWTNNHGNATVILHRMNDNGIRNGWNPRGGEDGYLVDEVGSVHAQGEAARAFGVFAYYHTIANVKK